MGDGMENSLSSEHRDFLQLLRCLLKSKGISYIQGQIEDFIEMVIQFNPWFPEHFPIGKSESRNLYTMGL
jgi:hypothetical protein